jgi:hypothetical protein
MKIEENVPIPTRAKAGGKPCLYQWAELEIGQSMFIPTRPATDHWRRKLGRQFVTRAAEQDGVKGWRVWRV